MKTSLFKELRELVLPFVALLLVAYFAVEAVLEDGQALIFPTITPNHPQAHTALFAVLALAFWQFAGERLRGTHAYLVLRGVSRGQLFGAKAGAGLLAVAAAFGLALAFHLIVLQENPNAPLFETAGVREVLALLCVVLPVYGIGVLLAVGWDSGSGQLFGRFALAAFASAGLVVGTPRLLGDGLGDPRLILQVVVFALILSLGLWLAIGRFRSLADGDISEPAGRVRMRTALLVVLILGQLQPLVRGWQRFLGSSDTPIVVTDGEGRFAEFLVGAEFGGYAVVDSSGETLALLDGPPRTLDKKLPGQVWHSVERRGWRWFEGGTTLVDEVAQRAERSAYSSRSQLALARTVIPVAESAMQRDLVFTLPSGVVFTRLTPYSTSVKEFEQVPRLDLDPERAVRFELAGPRFSSSVQLRYPTSAEPGDLPVLEDPETGMVSTWEETQEGLRLVDAAQLDLVPHQGPEPLEYPVVLVRVGEQAVFDESGDRVDGWNAPRTKNWKERRRAANFALVTALQPSLWTLAASLQPTGLPPIDEPGVRLGEPSRPDPRAGYLSWRLTGLRRPLTTLFSVVLAGLMTFSVVRRERGAGRWFWIALTASVGIVGWLAWSIARAPARREAAARRAMEEALQGAAEELTPQASTAEQAA